MNLIIETTRRWPTAFAHSGEAKVELLKAATRRLAAGLGVLDLGRPVPGWWRWQYERGG